MPTVGNKKYPYTKKGIADAKKAAKKVGGGKTPPKSAAKKASAKPLTAYQKAVKGPAKSAGKGKLQPYDAKWKAGVAKKSKRTGVDKVAEGILKYSPLAGIAYGFEAATGKSVSGPMNKPAKKVNRLGAAANAATYVVGGGALGKAAKKTVKTLRATKGAGEMATKKSNQGQQVGKAEFDNYVNILVNKQLSKKKKK
jgi:hypothetical protein